MRKLVIYTAASLDHYIARDDGSVDWLSSDEMKLPNEDYGYKSFYSRIDSLVMGHKTWKHIQKYDYPYPGKKCFVFTRGHHSSTQEEVSFVQDDLASFIHQLKAKEGKDIWLVGGGQINGQLIKLGLVDEIIITLIPITLGSGISVFGLGAGQHQLHLKSYEIYENGVVQLSYTVLKNPPLNQA